MAQHIIFDFDGTLIDSCPAILETLGRVLQGRGITPTRPLSRELIGPPLLATLEICTGISDKVLLEKLAADFRESYDSEGLFGTVAYADVHATLQQLRTAGGELHLATNKRQRPTLLLLQHFGWERWFRSVYCVDSRSPPFPDKGEMLLALLKEQELAPAAALYVGDTAHDEKAAAKAGLEFFAAGWGYGAGDQAVSARAKVLHSARELLVPSN